MFFCAVFSLFLATIAMAYNQTLGLIQALRDFFSPLIFWLLRHDRRAGNLTQGVVFGAVCMKWFYIWRRLAGSAQG